MGFARPASSLEPGDVLGGYLIVRQAAGGGASRVYFARDGEGAPVALKVLGGAAGADFLREAALLAQLEHPCIVRYLAHGLSGSGAAYLVTEWLDGEELGERLRRLPLSEDEARRLLRRAAEGLGAAHARGVVHGDVTPANLFLEEGDPARTKLIDFGVATRQKASLGASSPSGKACPRGTAGYVAPEQLLGSAPSPRGDVFALGCVLHEALAGEPAFFSEHALGAHARALASPPPSLDARARVSPGLAALVARMLAREPGSRPADGSALLRELAALEERGGALPALPLSAERRLISALVVASGGASDAEGRKALSEDGGRLAAGASEAARVAGRAGLVLGRVSARSVALRVEARASPGENAARAAEAALDLVREAPPGKPPPRVALVTVLVDPSEPGAMDALLERTAGRLENAGEGAFGHPLADATTSRLLEDRFELAAAGQEAWVLGPRRTWPPPRALPCLGRDAELALLEASFAQCEAEPMARGLLVTGAAGSGKSRLVEELCARLLRRASPPRILFGRGDPRLGASCRALEGLVEFLAAPDERGAPPEETQRALLEGLALACARGPVVLVLEDLQWADPASVRLLATALAELASAPLFVVAVGRPEVHAALPGLLEDRGLEEIRVGGIGARAAERLVREALGREAPDGLVRALAQRAAGSPFFLEELIRAVAAGRGDHLPDAIVGAVQERLDPLGEESKRLLRAASILGARFTKRGLEALLPDLGGHETEAALSALVRNEVILPVPGATDAFAFRHEILREAAHATIPGADRARGHLLAGLWLEREGAGDALALARHFEAGGALGRAAHQHRVAAEQALAAGELEQALDFAERAEAAGATGEELGRVRLVESEALGWRGDGAASVACGREAAALLPKGSDAWFAATGNVILGLGRQLRAEEAEGATLGALSAAPVGLASAKVACLAKAVLAMALLANRAFTERVLAIAERLGAALDPESPAEAPIVAELLHARAAFELGGGNPFGALEAERRALELHERAGEVRAAALAEGHLGCAYLELGALELAEACLARAQSSAEALGHATTAAWARLNRSHALALRGETARALCEAEAARRSLAGQSSRRLEAAALLFAARARLSTGDAEAALARASEAVSLAEGAPAVLASALAALAAALLARGDAGSALSPAEAARALLEEHGSFESGESFIRLVHAEVLAALGHPEAPRALAEAEFRLLARAACVLDPALRASFLALPENARTLALAARR